MTQVSTPHDEFFKRVFSRQDAAHSFLANYSPPEINALFDLEGLRIVRDSFVDEELRPYHSDILYSVTLRDGGEGYVYVLFEHKSFFNCCATWCGYGNGSGNEKKGCVQSSPSWSITGREGGTIPSILHR